MTPEEIWDFLRDGHTGILTTLRADGVPIAMPVWYVVLDGAIYVSTRGKKVSRVRNDPRCSFLVEAGERWAELQAVHVTGRAEIVEDDDLHRRVSEALARKYAGFRTRSSAMPAATRGHYARAGSALIRITPDERILNWDNRKLGVR